MKMFSTPGLLVRRKPTALPVMGITRPLLEQEHRGCLRFGGAFASRVDHGAHLEAFLRGLEDGPRKHKLRTTRLKVEAGVTFTRGNQMGEDDAADEGSGQDKSDSVQGFVFPDKKRKRVAGQEIDSQMSSPIGFFKHFSP